jgi:hypothetical protein
LAPASFGLIGARPERYRRALRDAPATVALAKEADALVAAGAELSPASRRRLPPGFVPETPAARVAMRDGFQITRRFDRPAEATSARFVPWCVDRLVPFGSIHHWLVENTAR